MAYSESKVRKRLTKAASDALKEIGMLMKKDILKAFDNEHGYNESGMKVPWEKLDPEYVNAKPPRGRDGSSHPILNFEGDLRKAIDVRVKGFVLDNDVFSTKMKERGGKGKISVKDISENLRVKRPHTNPSSKFHEGGDIIGSVLSRHFEIAIKEMVEQGYWN